MSEKRLPVIRPAEPKDAPRISALLKEVQALHAAGRPDIFKNGMQKYTDADLVSKFGDPEKPIFVSVDESGQVTGYVFCIYQHTAENHQLHERLTLYIDDLCVDARLRGQGIGRALYQYAVREAQSRGADSVTLNVWALNKDAAAFYDRCGMTPLKTLMEYRIPSGGGTSKETGCPE